MSDTRAGRQDDGMSEGLTTPARSVEIGGTTYAVDVPHLSDPRMHVAAVVISLHVLGQTVLDFEVSVIHIVAAIATCAVMEGFYNALQHQRLGWPGSAMLTGSGIGLILRLPQSVSGEPWATGGWEVYVLVSALAMATKYVIRQRGVHVFNPSNIALVLVFVALGADRVEPLDFWWLPIGAAMGLAYAVILYGGLIINGRLGFLPLVGIFWVTLAAGIGVLGAADHCITAAWSFQPICGGHFWWVVMTSPETMIFALFMISDPRTIPESVRGRLVFGVAVGVLSALLMAPADTEFGAKVGLLAGLLVATVGRAAVRTSPALSTRLMTGWSMDRRLRPAEVMTLIAGVAVLSISLVWLDGFADSDRDLSSTSLPDVTGVLPPVDPASLPPVLVHPDAVSFDEDMAGVGGQELAARLAWTLLVENRAVELGDTELIRGVDHGRRRDEMLELVAAPVAERTLTSYAFEELGLVVRRSGSQGGARLAFEATGRRRLASVDGIGLRAEPFELTFVLLGTVGDRWFLVDVLPTE